MSKNNINYSTYTLFDFLVDPYFKQWVLNNDEATEKYWQDVLLAHPEQTATLQKAVQLFKNLPPLKNPVPVANQHQLWQRIAAEINTTNPLPTRQSYAINFTLAQYAKYAAVLIAVIGVFLAVWLHQFPAKITITTGNGIYREIALADGSIVQLGPNSSINYTQDFIHKTQRQVWAKGDVRFNVKHLNQNPQQVKAGERFIVHLANQVDVEVLGTIFDISDRRGQAFVRLQSGSVKVIKANQQLLLKPGESASSATQTAQLNLNKSSTTGINREWENKLLVLNKTKMTTIITLLEDNYGLQLQVDDKNILQKEIDGAIPLNDQQKALQIITSITNTKIIHSQNHLILISNR